MYILQHVIKGPCESLKVILSSSEFNQMFVRLLKEAKHI